MAGSRSSTSSLRGVLVKLLLHRGSTSSLTSPSRPPNTTAETRLSLVALHAEILLPSHLYGCRPVPDNPARRPGAPQRDDQVGEAHALACGYPAALRWGYHGVQLPRAVHIALPTPGRRRRTQVRLASPAERWGGFGTCVQSKAPGPHSSPNSTSSTWRQLGQRSSPPEHPTKKGLSLPRRSPGADALHGPTFMR